MRLKLGLLRPGGEVTDLVLTVDATATVADIAHVLEGADPAGQAPSPAGTTTLRRHADGAPPMVLAPELTVGEAGLRSGAQVSLATASEFVDGRGVAAAALLRVLSGPDAGRQVELSLGSTQLGRDYACDVRLTDPLVSKRHARINVGETAEVVDLNSANGVHVGGGRVQRATLSPQDSFVIGDTEMSVTLLPRATQGPTGSVQVDVIRSPVLLPVFPELEVAAPDPPPRARRQRLPLLALLAPLGLGAVMYAVTRSPLTLVFVALSPLLMLGSLLDTRRNNRLDERDADEAFAAAVDAVRTDLEERRREEVTARLAEMPSTADAVEGAYRLSPLLWSRRPDRAGFLRLRLGTGCQPSRTRVVLPTSNSTTATHWQALQALQRDLGSVEDVPVIADLAEIGTLGIAGPAAVAVPVAQGLVLQLAALHSPSELVVTGVAAAASAASWDWLKWLPHTGSAHSPLVSPHLASDPAGASALVTELEELVAARTSAGDGKRSPELVREHLPAVVVVVEDDAPVERSRLVALAERGPAVLVHVVWRSVAVERLPSACGAFLSLDAAGAASAGFVGPGLHLAPVRCETVSDDVALAVARRLAPLNDAGARVEDASDLPAAVSFLALSSSRLAEDGTAIVERWTETGSLLAPGGEDVPRPESTLSALVGQGVAEPFSLDLRTQGPHALVGGTTGAGKSEFLQSWILGMATTYSPRRVTFLFIDYKGGSAFADCVRLPHCVGLVTDLSPHLVRRALQSLRAELRHRERVLNSKKAKDLLELERKGDPDAPPSLVIVVDEFAALVQEVPEFVDGVVDVAQRGRSLGLHLVLATQRPAGVIKDNLRANTNLRVALRMADAEDSTDVLGLPMAADFDPATPGRGAVRTGPGRVQTFQAAYAGGRTSEVPPPPRIDIRELSFGAGRVWEMPTSGPVRRETGPTDIARTVDAVRAASELAGLPAPRPPWLGVLARSYDSTKLTQRTDAELVLGVIDLPDEQLQEQFSYRPDEDGSMVVIGTGGSGKSTVLRTIAHAAAVSPRGGPCLVYALDFSSGGLAALEELPHVGAVISGDDVERTVRLLTRLKVAVDERSARYAAARATSISQYRELANAPDEPRLLLLVDGLATFRSDYELSNLGSWWTTFQQIVMDGRAVGVHVVLTADRPGSVPASLGASLQRRLVLRLADPADYSLLDCDDDVLKRDAPPGRGIWDGHEVQVAVIGGSPNLAEQSRAGARMAATMQRVGIAPAPGVESLPQLVPLSSLPVEVDGLPVFGVADDDLLPVGLAPHGAFVVAGPPGSGRTTVLSALVSSLRRFDPSFGLYYLGNRRSPLAGLPLWSASARTPDEVEELARKLVVDLADGRASGRVCVVVEGLTDFLSGPAEQCLQELLAVCRTADHLVVAESETSTLAPSWPLVTAVKAARRGIVLQPDQTDGDTLFRTSFPRVKRADFPPGRGLLVAQGRVRRVQVAFPEWTEDA